MTLHLENIRSNATDVEKEWENLQYILKSAPYESLGKIKRQKKEIFKNIEQPNKTLNRSKDHII